MHNFSLGVLGSVVGATLWVGPVRAELDVRFPKGTDCAVVVDLESICRLAPETMGWIREGLVDAIEAYKWPKGRADEELAQLDAVPEAINAKLQACGLQTKDLHWAAVGFGKVCFWNDMVSCATNVDWELILSVDHYDWDKIASFLKGKGVSTQSDWLSDVPVKRFSRDREYRMPKEGLVWGVQGHEGKCFFSSYPPKTWGLYEKGKDADPRYSEFGKLEKDEVVRIMVLGPDMPITDLSWSHLQPRVALVSIMHELRPHISKLSREDFSIFWSRESFGARLRLTWTDEAAALAAELVAKKTFTPEWILAGVSRVGTVVTVETVRCPPSSFFRAFGKGILLDGLKELVLW